MQQAAYTFDEDIVSDLHKDAYGFRPRQDFWERWDSSTDAQKQQEWDWLCEQLDARLERQQLEQKIALSDLVQAINALKSYGAHDTAMAVKWLHEAHETDGDDGFLEYKLGVAYGTIANLG